MRNEELVPVARVTIEHGGRFHEIPRCWISVEQGGKVAIWLSPSQDPPFLRLPLGEVKIDWPELEIAM